MSDLISEFRAAMADAGLVYSGEIKADTEVVQRFNPDGTNGQSGWYKLHTDGAIPAGAFGDWRTGLSQKWSHKNGNWDSLSTAERAEFKRKIAEDAKRREAEEKARHERTALRAVEYCKPLTEPPADFLYLSSKQVGAYGDLKFDSKENVLVLPIKDITGKLWGYQTVDVFGDKLFATGAKVEGCFFAIGKADDGPIVICEGYATGASIHLATGWPVICAMNCGNLKTVCSAVRGKYPDKTLVIAADDDRFTKKQGEPYNPGVEKAHEAAKSTGAVVAIPSFPANSKGTDFNDLQIECGQGVLRGTFHALLGIGMGQRITIQELINFNPDEDPACVLGDRYLCRGGSCVIVAQTSAGKSSLGMQMAIMWALGRDFFGLKPKRPLKSLIIQAENDVGDTSDFFKGILAGMGLIKGDGGQGDRDIIEIITQNLIIIRDQTHSGLDFPNYAERLVELHKPDLFWVDPLLSFYGNDINDQQEMSRFLRSELNPISERTGIIWMMLHHTAKPSKEKEKSSKSSRDYAYLGIGSSELSNWARAIITVVATSDDEFRMIMAKRGTRAKLKDEHGNPVTELALAHSGDHICWKQIPKPLPEKEMDGAFEAFARTITTPMSATKIIKLAEAALKRGNRTCWSFWGSGDGPLGSLFEKDLYSNGYLPKHLNSKSASTPYAD